MDYGTLNAALDAAGTIMNRMQEMGDLMGQVAQRMEGYADELSAVQRSERFCGKNAGAAGRYAHHRAGAERLSAFAARGA